MAPPTNSNESYCTFTLASDVTAGGLPSEDEIAKDLESNDNNVSCCFVAMIDINGWCDAGRFVPAKVSRLCYDSIGRHAAEGMVDVLKQIQGESECSQIGANNELLLRNTSTHTCKQI